MSQNNIIAGALIFAFVMFVTMRGELPSYLSIFTKGSTAKGGSGSIDLSAFINQLSGGGSSDASSVNASDILSSLSQA